LTLKNVKLIINIEYLGGENKMAEKKKSSTTTTTSTSTKKSSGYSFGYILNILAFVAVVIGGIALFIAMILAKLDVSAGAITALQKVANSIGWAVLALLSFRFIKNRRRIWLWVVWAVAVVMIVVGIIL